jgi:hypothetical protein
MLKGRGPLGDLGLDKWMKVKINPRRKQVGTILFRCIAASNDEFL